MAYDLTGKIKVVKEAQTFGAKGFTKREFVVTVEEGKYPTGRNGIQPFSARYGSQRGTS